MVTPKNKVLQKSQLKPGTRVINIVSNTVGDVWEDLNLKEPCAEHEIVVRVFCLRKVKKGGTKTRKSYRYLHWKLKNIKIAD